MVSRIPTSTLPGSLLTATYTCRILETGDGNRGYSYHLAERGKGLRSTKVMDATRLNRAFAFGSFVTMILEYIGA